MRLGKDVIATDLYGVLGVPRNATDEQIRRAYRLQAMTSHPDLHGANAEQRMVELNVAACVLLDSDSRTEYDRQRANHRDHAPTHTKNLDDWYPWGTTTSSERVEWSPPPPVEHAPLDHETQVELQGLRKGAHRSLHQLLDWSNTWPPGAHLIVTFASVCLALLLIASAKPSSLPGFQERPAVACVEDD